MTKMERYKLYAQWIRIVTFVLLPSVWLGFKLMDIAATAEGYGENFMANVVGIAGFLVTAIGIPVQAIVFVILISEIL